MATITINVPDEYKDWLSEKARGMTDVIHQFIEEEMYREKYENKIRFIPKKKKEDSKLRAM